MYCNWVYLFTQVTNNACLLYGIHIQVVDKENDITTSIYVNFNFQKLQIFQKPLPVIHPFQPRQRLHQAPCLKV